MITFNLERALAGDKVITREGGEVNQLVSINTSSCIEIYGYDVENNEVEVWCTDGSHCGNVDSDLFMAPRALSGFVNVYNDRLNHSWHSTKELADKFALEFRTGCIDLSTHNEGEGL